MGLALGCAVTALFTNGLKLVIGNPRPDLLSRCNPKLSEASSYVLGGFNNQVSDGALVSWTICQQTDRGILADGFQSFPSGHSSCKFEMLKAEDRANSASSCLRRLLLPGTILVLKICHQNPLSSPRSPRSLQHLVLRILR